MPLFGARDVALATRPMFIPVNQADVFIVCAHLQNKHGVVLISTFGHTKSEDSGECCHKVDRGSRAVFR
jgi:hypothetical protein